MAAPVNKVKLPQKRRSQYQSLETIGDRIVTSYPGNVKTMLYNMQNFMYTCNIHLRNIGCDATFGL